MNFEKSFELIKKGVVDVIGEEDLVSRLKEKRPLNIKFGVDPTAPDIHLGHTVPLQKLKTFQELGHNVFLLIGNYTAKIGDPAGRSETRPILTDDEIAKNVHTYKTQVFKILDEEKTNIVYNADWLSKFSLEDLLRLTTLGPSVNSLIQRRDFSTRLEKNETLSTTELIYPLLVGYDSVKLQADVEIGGTDQLFNFQASREVQKAYGQQPEVAITLPILTGPKGTRKMSKSLGNSIGVTEDPKKMFTKLMKVEDTVMPDYFLLLTSSTLDQHKNPLDEKKRLAKTIVSQFHSLEKAIEAQKYFDEVIIGKNLVPTIIEYETPEIPLSYVVSRAHNVGLNQATRLIRGNAVRIDGERITDHRYQVNPNSKISLRVTKTGNYDVEFKKV